MSGHLIRTVPKKHSCTDEAEKKNYASDLGAGSRYECSCGKRCVVIDGMWVKERFFFRPFLKL